MECEVKSLLRRVMTQMSPENPLRYEIERKMSEVWSVVNWARVCEVIPEDHQQVLVTDGRRVEEGEMLAWDDVVENQIVEAYDSHGDQIEMEIAWWAPMPEFPKEGKQK